MFVHRRHGVLLLLKTLQNFVLTGRVQLGMCVCVYACAYMCVFDISLSLSLSLSLSPIHLNDVKRFEETSFEEHRDQKILGLNSCESQQGVHRLLS